MAALGPFEARPRVAVAVSGGVDSMALCLLADAWARECSGSVLALIVDHGLRAGSAGEARQAACWLTAIDIDSEILVWRGEKPTSAIHAQARQARYRLLTDRCREQGVLHLLVGHHQGDQAETMLLRTARGSGLAGLAGMSALVETGAVRVLRPLLDVPKNRLRAYVTSRGQAWIEDPSNADPAFARTRVRSVLARTDAAPAAFAEAAARCRELRRPRDEAVADLLARHCRLHPLGFIGLDPAILSVAEGEIVDAALARVAATVGGMVYPPDAGKLARLRRHLLCDPAKAASLGRCIWQPSRLRSEIGSKSRVWMIFREPRNLPPPRPITPGSEVEWDGRFLVRIAADALCGEDVRLEALGEGGWAEALHLRPCLRGQVLRSAAVTLPALRGAQGLLAVSGLGLDREPSGEGMASVRFRPRRSLSGSGYYLA